MNYKAIVSSGLLLSICVAQAKPIGPGEIYEQDGDFGGNQLKLSSELKASGKGIPTGNWWSTLAFNFSSSNDLKNEFTAPMFVYPLMVKTSADGFALGSSGKIKGYKNHFKADVSQDVFIGLQGIKTTGTVADNFSDWTATALWQLGEDSLRGTFGSGLPYIYFKKSGNKLVTIKNTGVIKAQDNILKIEVGSKHYAVFAPSGSNWKLEGGVWTSSLNQKDYFSVATLPDNKGETLTLFNKHAFAFVTNTHLEYAYDENRGELTTTYEYQTEQQEQGDQYTDTVLTSVLPYQNDNLVAEAPLKSQRVASSSFETLRGPMAMLVLDNNKFSTKIKTSGVLPILPAADKNAEARLNEYFDQEKTPLNAADTYANGKQMGRVVQLIQIADQLGKTEARDQMINDLKTRLEDWFKGQGEQKIRYSREWQVILGTPASFGTDKELNDLHFHFGYFIQAAAAIAQYDKDWAKTWEPMIRTLINNTWNIDGDNSTLPLARTHNFDIFEGHSWASGHGSFGDNNNEESSSEAMNFYTAVILWGENIGDKKIRDLGVYLYNSELQNIERYHFNNNALFPKSNFDHDVVGIMWGGKSDYSTWFAAGHKYIYGINLLPINGGSIYLGRYPNFHVKQANIALQEDGGSPIAWGGIMLEALAMGDPQQALSKFNASYANKVDGKEYPENGESLTHIYHWINSMKKLGNLQPEITASTPTAAAFSKNSQTQYVAYLGKADAPKTIRFYSNDGTTMVHSMTVEPYSMKVSSGGDQPGDQLLPPSELSAVDIQSDRVVLQWKIPVLTAGIEGYVVEANKGEISQQVSGATNTQVTLHQLKADTEYTFTIKSVNRKGEQSASSNTVTVKTKSDGGSPDPDPTPGDMTKLYFSTGANVKNATLSQDGKVLAKRGTTQGGAAIEMKQGAVELNVDGNRVIIEVLDGDYRVNERSHCVGIAPGGSTIAVDTLCH